MRARKPVLFVSFAFAALALGECAARRLFPPPEYVRGLVFDPVLGFRSRPDHSAIAHDEEGTSTWATNSLGFLGPELPAEDEPKNTQRLLFLGDSFLHVWGVRPDNAMTEVSARLLAAAGRPSTAWNVSCNGWGTVQELLALRAYGPSIRPDVVVLEFYGANDVATNGIELADRTFISTADFLHPYLVFDPADPEAEPELRWTQPVRAFLRRHSRLFGVLDLGLQVQANARGIDWLRYGPRPLPKSERAGLSPVEGLEFLRPHPADHPWERAWATTEALVAATAREARELGARFLLLVVPHRTQVQRDARVLVMERRARGGLEAWYDWNGAEARLARLAREREIEAIFLLERLRARARAGELAYQYDGHLNTLGQRLAAEAVVEHLESGTSAADPVPAGAPVDLLVDLPRRLDWKSEDVGRLLDAAWSVFDEDALGGGPGCAIQSEACAVLRGGPGTLLVRGSMPEVASFPVNVRVRVRDSRANVELARPGPFELRLEVQGPGSAPVLVELKVSRTFRWGGDTRAFGAVIHELGFAGE